MRVTKLIIKNIGLIADETIVLDKPLLLFYGSIRQGKSTILNAVRWVCGAKWPSDIIKHGERVAGIELEFVGGSISRSWYRNKAGETTARDIQFIKDGKPVSRPAQAIQSLLNPFLLNQNHLADMGEAERKKFFTDLFAVDTTELDREAFDKNREAQTLRATLAAYGEIDLTPHEAVDVGPLRQQLASMRENHEDVVDAINEANDRIRGRNNEVSNATRKRGEVETALIAARAEVAALESREKQLTAWLSANKEEPLRNHPQAPDTTDLEARIQNAGATNARAEQYQKNKTTAAKRDEQQGQLEAAVARERAIKAEKIAKLSSVTDESGIKGLKFDEDGNFTYNGTTASMLSTSEIMQLSSELSAMFPSGFDLSLIDRAESLGESIFDYVDKAKAESKVILATIVGEKPAKVPSDVGVWVVKNGKLEDGRLL